jgi:hypothetical protein
MGGNMKKLIISMMAGGLLLFFQNCSDAVHFASETGAMLTAVDQDETDNNETLPDDDGDGGGDGGDSDDGDGDDGGDKGDDGGKCDHSKKGELVACILKGPGKSMKLGLVEQGLGAVNAVSKSVCVTPKGCLEQVSQKFEVIGIGERGYCAGNPNVVQLSDEELAALLADL